MEMSPKTTDIINKWREGGNKRRESLLNARELYENLPDNLKDEVDALSEAVTNKVLENAEVKYGDAIYFGQQFSNDLKKACRDYSTGHSRDSGHFTSAFLSEPRWNDTVNEAFEYITNLINTFPELKELANKPTAIIDEQISKTEIIDVQIDGSVSEEGVPEATTKVTDTEIQDDVVNSDLYPDQDKQYKVKVLERTLSTSSLEKKLDWLRSLQLYSEYDVLDAANKYIEKFPPTSRLMAVSEIFDNAQIDSGLEYDKKRTLCAAVIIDNFSNASITSESELKRLIEHHQYKYQREIEKSGISSKGLIDLFINYGFFSPSFSKQDAEQFVSREYKV